MRVLNKKIWPSALQLHLIDNKPSFPSTYVNEYVDERTTWCKENLPKNSWFAYENNWTGKKTFAFIDENDVLMFKLRYGHEIHS